MVKDKTATTENSDKKPRKSSKKERFDIEQQVRVPTWIYKKLVEEAVRTGIGQVAVLARFILFERLQRGQLDNLAAAVRVHYGPSADGEFRININLSCSNKTIVDKAVNKLTGGNFGGLVKAILYERYCS